MVDLKSISKRYPNGVKALNDINIHIEPKEFIYVIGATGSGKSTLIKIIDGEEIPTSGQAIVAGVNVGKLRHSKVPHYRRNIGVVFQDFKLLETKTVFENIYFALEVVGLHPKLARERVREVLRLVGLAGKAKSFPNELSGGQQQRAAIARAIANRPKLLIADEPTGNLDPKMSQGIMALLEKINKEEGTTIIMVTHDDNIVNKYKKRTIILDSGYIAADLAEGGYLSNDKEIFRHIREGLSNVFRNFAMSVSSISAVTITLILVGAFFIITTNVASISTSIKSSLTILVKIDRETSENDITILKEKIENISEVKSVTYSSKHEELQKQIDLYPQQADYYRRHEGKDNPLYDVFIVEVDDATYLSAVNEQVANLKGIYSAEQGGDGVEKLVTYLNSMQSIGWILVGVLTFLAVYLIANTIKVTIYSRREEIGIMRTVGASNGFIRAPYLVGGIIIGGIGSIIPIILMGFGYNYLYNETGGILMSKIFVLQPVFPFVYQLSGLLLALGVTVGFVGSFFSVTRYLRWKR